MSFVGRFGGVGLELLEHRSRFGDKISLIVLPGKGQRIGCKRHRFVMSAMFTSDFGEGQTGIDGFWSSLNDMF